MKDAEKYLNMALEAFCKENGSSLSEINFNSTEAYSSPLYEKLSGPKQGWLQNCLNLWHQTTEVVRGEKPQGDDAHYRRVQQVTKQEQNP